MIRSRAHVNDETTRQRLLLIGLLTLSLLVRLFLLLKFPPDNFGDAVEYLDGARRLLDGKPLAAKNDYFFVRAPGYSLFVALVWAATGTRSVLILKLAQVFLAVGTCAYVIALARRLSDNWQVALLAGLVSALYPYHLVFSTTVGAAEVLSMFFLAASTYHLLLGLGASPNWRQVAVGSVALALANLTRPNTTTLLPILILFLMWLYRRNLRAGFGVVAIMSAAVVLVALPWSIAVHRQGLGWMFITDGVGASYFVGHGENAERLYCADISEEERKERLRFADLNRFNKTPEYALAKTLPPPQQGDVFLRAGLAWDRQNLGKLPCLFAMKVFHYWRPWVSTTGYSRSVVILSLLSSPILVFGTIGVWLALRNRKSVLAGLVVCHALAATLTAGLIHATIRYRAPTVDLLWMPFFGYGVVEVVRRLLQRARHNHGLAPEVPPTNG